MITEPLKLLIMADATREAAEFIEAHPKAAVAAVQHVSNVLAYAAAVAEAAAEVDSKPTEETT